MARVINLEACFARFSDTFSPRIVGDLNGQQVKLVRLEGDKVPWHAHGHVKLLLLEPDGIAHTGAVRADITRDSYERLKPSRPT